MASALERGSLPLSLGGPGTRRARAQLRIMLEERSTEVEVLRNRLEQRDASLQVLRRNYEEQVRAAQVGAEGSTACTDGSWATCVCRRDLLAS